MLARSDLTPLLESLPVAILVTDGQRVIEFANSAALALFGYPKGELVGREVEVLLPSRHARIHPELYASFVNNPSTRPMGEGRDLQAVKKDGREFPVEVGLTTFPSDPPVYVATVLDLTLRKQAEAVLEESLGKTRQKLDQQLAERTRLEERQRLGRELHDSLSQSLYGIGLGLRTALAKLDNQADPRQALDYCLDLTESALVEMRALLFKLRPKSLENVPLADVLESHSQAVASRTQLSISFENRGETPTQIDFERKYALYRIATEALHNCTKHARAKHILVKLSNSKNRLQLVVQDDGVGFSNGSKPGHGLEIMNERAEAVNGEVAIDSSAAGTTVTATVPLP